MISGHNQFETLLKSFQDRNTIFSRSGIKSFVGLFRKYKKAFQIVEFEKFKVLFLFSRSILLNWLGNIYTKYSKHTKLVYASYSHAYPWSPMNGTSVVNNYTRSIPDPIVFFYLYVSFIIVILFIIITKIRIIYFN